MPVRWEFDHARRFIYVTAEGDVVIQEVLDCYEQFTLQDGMSYAKLWDATRAELLFSDDDVMTLGAWTSAFAEYEPRGPIAIVAVTDTCRQMMKRYMGVGKGDRALRLFRSVTNARKWLDVQSAVNAAPQG